MTVIAYIILSSFVVLISTLWATALEPRQAEVSNIAVARLQRNLKRDLQRRRGR